MAVHGEVPVAAIVPAFPAGAYRHYTGTITLPENVDAVVKFCQVLYRAITLPENVDAVVLSSTVQSRAAVVAGVTIWSLNFSQPFFSFFCMLYYF